MQRRSGKADGQLRESFVALGRPGRQPGVENDCDLATAAALVLSHDRPRELCRRAPVDPPQAIAALPRAQAVIISLARSALRMPALIAELLGLQPIGPRWQQASQARRDDQLTVLGQRHLAQYQTERKSRADSQRSESIPAATR